MHYIRKILPVLLVFSMLIQVAYAENEKSYLLEKDYLDDISDIMDSIYQYDVGEFKDSQKSDTVDTTIEKYQKQIDVICALGFMEKNDNGEFNGTDKLLYSDFSKAMSVMYYGDNVFKDYSNEDTVTFKAAAETILSALGYDVCIPMYQSKDEWAEHFIGELGLLKDLTYNPEKEILRNEFAVLLYNSLDAEMMVSESLGEYDVKPDSNILEEKLDILRFEGLLNGVEGLNIYSSKVLEGTLQIDREKIYYGDLSVPRSLFGKRVDAYIKYDENLDRYKLLYISESDTAEYIEVSLRDVLGIENGKLEYLAGDSVKKAKIEENCKILYNGTAQNDYEFINDLAEGEGVLILSKSVKNGGFDVLIVKKYSDYVLLSANSEKRSMSFKYNAKFNGSTNIEISEDAVMYIEADGILAEDLSDASMNSVVSMYMNEAKTYAEIMISNASVQGKITGVPEKNEVTISDKEYRVSENYLECVKTGSDAEELRVGTEGVYYLTYDNRIAGCKLSSAISYAYLRKIIKDDETESIILEMFTEENEWVKTNLKEDVSVDGKKYSAENAYTYLNSGELVGTLISYKKKGDYITEVNTIKGEVSLDYSHETTLDWKLAAHIPQSKGASWFIDYKIRDNTTVFKIPKDLNDKEEFMAFKGNTNLYTGETFLFEFYNCNSFYVPEVLMCRETSQSESQDKPSGVGVPLYITSISQTLDAEDEMVYQLNGYRAKNMGGGRYSFSEGSIFIEEKYFEKFGIAKDRLYNFVVEDEYVVNAEEWFNPAENADTWKQEGDGSAAYPYIAIGTIGVFDVEERMIRIDMLTDRQRNYSFVLPGTVALIEDGEFSIVDISEFKVGDRIFTYAVRENATLTMIVR